LAALFAASLAAIPDDAFAQRGGGFRRAYDRRCGRRRDGIHNWIAIRTSEAFDRLRFPPGFLLVVIAGAELFTGNNLIVMAWAGGKVSTRDLLRNWTIVFAGNFIGAFATAILMFFTTWYSFGGGAMGLAALSSANAKSSLAFVPAVTLGIMCNALVCLASWMCYSARSNADKFFTVVPPITAFVAAGFEHSIANIYYIPSGLFIKAGAPDAFWASIGKRPISQL
jgi:formate/nitrite transporter